MMNDARPAPATGTAAALALVIAALVTMHYLWAQGGGRADRAPLSRCARRDLSVTRGRRARWAFRSPS